MQVCSVPDTAVFVMDRRVVSTSVKTEGHRLVIDYDGSSVKKMLESCSQAHFYRNCQEVVLTDPF